MVAPEVGLEVHFLGEGFAAGGAAVRPLPGVRQAVAAQVAGPREGLPALATTVPSPQRQQTERGGQDVRR